MKSTTRAVFLFIILMTTLLGTGVALLICGKFWFGMSVILLSTLIRIGAINDEPGGDGAKIFLSPFKWAYYRNEEAEATFKDMLNE